MARSQATLLFIGVTTGGSFIHRLFPVWAEALGLGGARLQGVDIPLEAPPERIHAALDLIAGDEAVRGALITTHKIAVLRHGANRIATLDRYARLLGEASAIARRDGQLIGCALDPIASGLALDRLAPRRHWVEHAGAEALIMGAGGAGVALIAHLLERPPEERPARMTITDVDPARLAHARDHLAALDRSGALTLTRVEDDQDTLLAGLPPASLVVNATGMGKDRPGSPITDRARLPEGALIWELNYRGERAFLAQCQAQAKARGLRIADGWVYFLYGWAHVIAVVFQIELDDATMARLEAAAAALRSP